MPAFGVGRRPLEVFWRVSLAVARPSLLAGLLLAWLRAFGEFGATVMVAYHPYSLPVYTYVAFGAQGLPAMLPVLLPALVLALTLMPVMMVRRAKGRTGARPRIVVGFERQLERFTHWYERGMEWSLDHPRAVFGIRTE